MLQFLQRPNHKKSQLLEKGFLGKGLLLFFFGLLFVKDSLELGHAHRIHGLVDDALPSVLLQCVGELVQVEVVYLRAV